MSAPTRGVDYEAGEMTVTLSRTDFAGSSARRAARIAAEHGAAMGGRR